jgi:two-component system NarL family sensor kinase
MALIVTGFLSQRLRKSQKAIVFTQTQLEAQAQLVRLRENFTSTLTHDLKTPLLGAIETIKAFQQEKFVQFYQPSIKFWQQWQAVMKLL